MFFKGDEVPTERRATCALGCTRLSTACSPFNVRQHKCEVSAFQALPSGHGAVPSASAALGVRGRLATMVAQRKLVVSQAWKLWLSAAVMALAGTCSFASEAIGRAFGVEPAVVGLSGAALSLATLAFAALSITCPACGLQLAWYAVTKKSANKWLSWLLAVECCPRCHHPATTRGESVA